MVSRNLSGGNVATLAENQSVFDLHESSVRSYCRVFPGLFARGDGAYLFDKSGRKWLDFLSGAGALNYGHNHPRLKRALMEYIDEHGVVTSLDLHTEAKERFLSSLNEVILGPRRLEYKTQFCGPTGTNAIEASLKLAEKVTQRRGFVAFTNSYHGMTARSMSVSSSFRRRGNDSSYPGVVTFMPFDGFTGLSNELEFVRKMLTAKGSGTSPPAAFIVELVQGEGGVNIASSEWVREIQRMARELGSLFIVDEIQSGCGRTGKFFSFEHHGISPDIVCLSKSLSGFGLPMSLALISPQFDVWNPGEHNGTFRGFNYAFVTAAEALRYFWSEPGFERVLSSASRQLAQHLHALRRDFPELVTEVRQLGLFVGICMKDAASAAAVQRQAFERGLIVEACGPEASTIKLLPPLIVRSLELQHAFEILRSSIRACVA